MQVFNTINFILNFSNENKRHRERAEVELLYGHLYGLLVVVGVDALPGREGGTWFGVSSKFAKIGALLNISEIVLDTSKRQRGHLVTDYLQSPLDAAAYIDTLTHQRSEFNPFNLVLLERRFVQLLVCF